VRLILVKLVARDTGRVEQTRRAHDRPLQIAAAHEFFHAAHVAVGGLADRRGDPRLEDTVHHETAVSMMVRLGGA
jgi:hypothetical protein